MISVHCQIRNRAKSLSAVSGLPVRQYYAQEGLEDPVHIRIAEGKYEPVFFYGRDENKTVEADESLPAVSCFIPSIAVHPFDEYSSLSLRVEALKPVDLNRSDFMARPTPKNVRQACELRLDLQMLSSGNARPSQSESLSTKFEQIQSTSPLQPFAISPRSIVGAFLRSGSVSKHVAGADAVRQVTK